MSDDIAAALAAPLAARQLVTVDVTVSPAGSRRILRVLVDRDVSGLDASDTSSRVAPLSLDEVADATKVISATLDASDLMGERAYTLEVSSPGVGRPLAGYAALRRNVGRLVALSLTSGEQVEGRVLGASADEVTVDVAPGRGTSGGRRSLSLGDVRSGTVKVEFAHLPDEQDQEH